MTTPIRLVAGLGNPGREYANTRHNAGFWFVDELAAKLGASFGAESKFAGEVAKAGALRLVKPMTFMNLSGRAVAALARFFTIAPDEILVVHDELDLLPGKVKMKLGGGHAGHNGLRDIQAQLGSADFWRLRIGIGHPRDSELTQQDVVDYVLKPPRAEELAAIRDCDAARAEGVARHRARRHGGRDDGAPYNEQGFEMSLKCGIVGLPNVGKSTLFNALTKAGIAAENYPFCTIEPNVGIVEVPDPRIETLARIVKPERVVPAVVEFVDIAGLVAGASKGEGLGNQFLANIRETDAIAHVVRCFVDDNVIHVAGKIDPVSDIETINTELALADMAAVEKHLHKHEKMARGSDKESMRIVPVLEQSAGGVERRPAGADGEIERRGTGVVASVLPADDEADDVRGQCRGRRLPRQPAAGQGRSAREGGRRAGRRGVRSDRGRNRGP